MHKVTLMPGDGIGPEVTQAAQRVVQATGVKIEWEIAALGMWAHERLGNPLPNDTLNSIARNRVALKGPTGTPIGEGFRSVNVELRKHFDLYANVRPVKSFEGVPSRYKDVDLVVIRQNTEDLYIGVEREALGFGKGYAAEATSFISKHASDKIFRFAFNFAKQWGLKKVTAVHKANILKLTHGIFLKAGKNVASEYPDIAFEDKIADNMAMQLVLDPNRFSIIVAPNFIGDILSDLCAGLAGGLGIAPGANVGDNCAIFEAVHGTAPDIAGQNKANPCALILSAAMMLQYLGEQEACDHIEKAVQGVLREGLYVTGDISGKSRPVGTDAMTDAIIRKL